VIICASADSFYFSYSPTHPATRARSGQYPRCDVTISRYGARDFQGHTKKRRLRHIHVKNLVSLHSDENNGYFARRAIYIFYHILLNSSQNEKCFRQTMWGKIKKHILCSITSFRKSYRSDIKLKTNVAPGRPQMTIWRKRIACWIPKAIHTLIICTIILTVFPLQQLWHKRASMLRVSTLPVWVIIKEYLQHEK
jgi:hypothetical protein